MPLIHCCGRLQKTKAFICDPPEGVLYQRLDWLSACKICSCAVLQVTRIGIDNQVTYFRRTDDDARALFDRLRTSIRYRLTPAYTIIPPHSGSYLRYSDFGRTKRCYSSLSALSLGLFENRDLPVKKLFPPFKKTFSSIS